MARFRFRLQTVLEVRGSEEERRKREYLEARAERIALERSLADGRVMRVAMVAGAPTDFDSRKALETRLGKLESDERLIESQLSVLRDEEEAARMRWVKAHQDHEVLVNLREKALVEWNLAESRREQAELDEWAVLRR